MSAVHWPDHLLTLDEWFALPDDDAYRKAELVEGVLQVPPPPVSRHQVASGVLVGQLNASLVPAGFFAVQDVEVVLRTEFPPLVRIPDLTVVTMYDIRAQPRGFRGDQVRLVVEIVSPGSRSVDRIMKSAEYADAGIRHYWIVELESRVMLDAHRLRAGRYETTVREASGQVDVDLEGIGTIALDLGALVP